MPTTTVVPALDELEDLATRFSVSVERRPIQELALQSRQDDAILVVGHSETVGRLVRGFRADLKSCRAGKHPPEEGQATYGDIWILEIGSGVEACQVSYETFGETDEDTDCMTP